MPFGCGSRRFVQLTVATASLLALLAGVSAGCATTQEGPKAKVVPGYPTLGTPSEPPDLPQPQRFGAVLLRDATVYTAAGGIFSPGYVLMQDGLIKTVGEGEPPAAGENTTVVGLKGRFVTPGIIDTHSHLGVYPQPYVKAHSDGNEATQANKAGVWAEHAFWPQDPGLLRALAGGVTTLQVLPGSANLFGGRSFVAKTRPETSARAMRFPGAPQGLKIACGENPKRVYGDKGGPQTRMGNVEGYRKAFQEALEYRHKLRNYWRKVRMYKQHLRRKKDTGENKVTDQDPVPPDPPVRRFDLETLALVLDGKILVHNHCYRADEMHIMLDLAKEFGFKIRSFHHGLEAYKLAGRLAQENVSVSTWADWWGHKMETLDGIPQNAALLAAAGARPIIHSDSSRDIRYLNQEAAKAMAAGKRIGIDHSKDEALRWITLNAAWALGIDDKVGSLEPGKMGDVVVWSADPFSVYATVERVYMDGEEVYNARLPQKSDFELGWEAKRK